jgi:hypothetical protein
MNRMKLTALLLGSYITYLLASCRARPDEPRISERNMNNNDSEKAAAPVNLPLPAAVIKPVFAEGVMARRLYAYDTSDHRKMLHVRFDMQTVDTLNKLKLATAVDMSKFVAFAVRHVLDTYPEFKTIINDYLQRTEL